MSRLILALAGSAALAIAAITGHPSAVQAATPDPAPAATIATSSETPAPGPRGWRKGRGERHAALKNSPVHQTMRSLRELERLYLIGGRAQEIPTLYRDVLARTQNPAVRQFAFRRLARTDLKPADVDRSIATLRQGLDESLQRLPQP